MLAEVSGAMLRTLIERSSRGQKTIVWRAGGNLLLMLAVQAGILLALDQPFVTFGTIALAVGAASGFIKNQVDSGSLEIVIAKAVAIIKRLLSHNGRPQGPSGSSPVVLVPVLVLIPEHKLSQIDAGLQTKDIGRGRRRWIMTAIDQKLARERTPEFPAAA